MTKTEAAKLVAVIQALWPRPPITDRTSLAYEGNLSDLDFELCQVALSRLAKTSRWLPTVADIRSVACDVEHGPARLGAEAWGDVLAEIRRVGTYGLPRFADPVTVECVRALDWRGLCLGTNESADRARFVELYEGLAARGRSDVVAGHVLPPARGLSAALPRAGRSESLTQLLKQGGRG
jgi:hypothetical protein